MANTPLSLATSTAEIKAPFWLKCLEGVKLPLKITAMDVQDRQSEESANKVEEGECFQVLYNC